MAGNNNLAFDRATNSDIAMPDSGSIAPGRVGSDSDIADNPTAALAGDAIAPQMGDSLHPLDVGPAAPALQPRLDLVSKIADSRLRNRVEANIRLGTQQQIVAFTDQQRDLKAKAKAIIDQGGDLDSIPAKLMLGIDMAGRNALHAYATAHANPVTDPAIYYGLKNAALEDPAGFQNIDLSNHMAQLDTKDYGDLQQLQSDLRDGQQPTNLPLQQVYKANTDRLLQQLGLPVDLSPLSSPAANDNGRSLQKAALVRQLIDRHIAATEVATGRRMTPDDHYALLREVSAQRSRLRPSAIPPGGTPNFAGTSTALMGGAASDLALGAGETEAIASGGALLSALLPIVGWAGGILALSSTSTAGPALDELPPALRGSGTNNSTTPIPFNALPRAVPQRPGGRPISVECDKEWDDCEKLCSLAEHSSSMRGIWGGSWSTCLRGCVSEDCGGNLVR